jgi:transcriptional regulator with XRE-family HTH domain
MVKLDLESMARTKSPTNIVGPQIRKRRSDLDLTQEELATRCQLAGFDISRGTLSQIEAQLRCVTDDELLALARVLKVTTDSLYPADKRSRKPTISKQSRRPFR